MGSASTRAVLLYNGSPTEARFDLSYGPAAEMAPLDAGDDDAHTAFLRLARVRVRPLPLQAHTPMACPALPAARAHVLCMLACRWH